MKKSKITSILNSIEKLSTCESVVFDLDSDFPEITIAVSFSMDQAFNSIYNSNNDPESDLEVSPEDYILEQTIIFQHNGEEWQLSDENNTPNIYACQDDLRQHSDWSGFEVDHHISLGQGTDDDILAYLTELRNDLKEIADARENEPIEEIERYETHPHDAYRNHRLHIGKRENGDEFFFCFSDNHLAHNHNDLKDWYWRPMSLWNKDIEGMDEEMKNFGDKFAEIDTIEYVEITRRQLLDNIKYDRKNRRWYTDFAEDLVFAGNPPRSYTEWEMRENIITSYFVNYDGSELKENIVSDIVGKYEYYGFPSEENNPHELRYRKIS